jgi:hypothetical protein
MNWTKMPQTEVASFAHGTSTKMSEDPATFTSPAVSYKIMDASATRVENAYANRMNGPAAKTELKNAFADLNDNLHLQAAYVNSIANGDTATIENAGFVASSNIRKTKTIPAVPVTPSIKGNAAKLQLKINAVPGAKNYCWVIFTDSTGTVSVKNRTVFVSGAAIIIPDGKARETLHNLIDAGTKITVQVLAQNSAGKSGFSAAVSITVGS